MNRTAVEIAIWQSPNRSRVAAAGLAEAVRTGEAVAALRWWRRSSPGLRLAHVHGGRHDLWWEFALRDSFRWQSHLWRMAPGRYQLRLRRLVHALGLVPLLDTRAEDLSAADRARADLAAALLPGPDLLLWEEPFRLMATADCCTARNLIRDLVDTEGLTVVAFAAEPPGLRGLGSSLVPVRRAVPS